MSYCGDCLVLEGELHEEGCDQEICSKCGKQVLGWGKCEGVKPEPFFRRIFCCERCGKPLSMGKMVSDEDWKFICGATYPLDCVLCQNCMNFIKKKREEFLINFDKKIREDLE